jgi:hypothetical protein
MADRRWLRARFARALPPGARPSSAVVMAISLLLSMSCAAVYPEMGTRLRPISSQEVLDPQPPKGLRWIKFVSATVPAKARDGRSWDEVLGKAPDPYAKLLLNDKELLRTPAQTNTLSPSWPTAPRGNFRVADGDRLRVELWDANALQDKPIGLREIGVVNDEMRNSRELRVELDGGGSIVIAFEPAHPMLGLGLWYEVRTDSCFITRLLPESPAERAGLAAGDQVVSIEGKNVEGLSFDELRSRFNAVPAGGLALVIRRRGGSALSVKLREGPVYAPYDTFGAVD